MTVLERYPIYKTNNFYYAILFVLIMSLVIDGCVATIYYYHGCKSYHLMMALMFSVCLLMIFSVASPNISTGVYRYKVYIPDKKYIKQLQENYKIINQMGDVYLLEDL